MKKKSTAYLCLFVILAILLITSVLLFFYNAYMSGWYILPASERISLKEYKLEIGNDYIYCMKVIASKNSYEKIIKSRKLVSRKPINKKFPSECKKASWWDISENTKPEFYKEPNTDLVEMITRLDGIIYFSSMAW